MESSGTGVGENATEAKAYEVMTKMLNECEDVNFVYCEK